MKNTDLSKYIQTAVLSQQHKFLSLEKKVINSSDIVKKCNIAYDASLYATHNSTDIFSSEIIENAFIELGNLHHIELSNKFSPNSILHVITTAYPHGGHTRCVERWISILDKFTHSCILLNQNGQTPEFLEQAVKTRFGELITLETSKTMLDRALELRKIASNYEFIVLHTHMDDPIATIAFGNKDFKRPVIFFNHADHIFWLSACISDIVIDLNSVGHKITLNKRGIKNAKVIGIPSDSSTLKAYDKNEAKLKLGIDLEKRVIFASGNYKKFLPVNDISFTNIIKDTISIDKNIVFVVVGVNPKDEFWQNLLEEHKDQVLLFPTLDYHTDFTLYLSAADLVVDSYPVGGGAVLVDALCLKKPIVSLSFDYQADYIVNSIACFNTYNTFIEAIKKAITDTTYASKLFQDVYQKYLATESVSQWRENCENMLEDMRKNEHQNHSLGNRDDNISSVSLSTCRWVNDDIVKTINIKKTIKAVRRSLFRIKLKKDYKIIKLLGITFYQSQNRFNISH